MRKTRKKAALVLLALLTAAQLNGCGGKETTETTAEGTAAVQTTAHGDETGSGMETSAADGRAGTAGTETSAADGQTAGEGETVAPEEVVEDWMVPIAGDQVKDGEYDVEVKSSSSMFKITDCRLTVKDGEMTAVLTMSGTGYSQLFMGTGEEAVKADESAYIQAVDADGKCTFEIPVKALDEAIDCAAFSKKKEKWYDRKLAFLASSLGDAVSVDVKMTTISDLALEDGIYEADVVLEGGSGRASVESPAKITVKQGEATAEIIFSSPNYDYVRIGEEKYEPVNTEGNSAFEIPVDGFDYRMQIAADTVAMSTPHEIDYTLFFDSATIKKAE